MEGHEEQDEGSKDQQEKKKIKAIKLCEGVREECHHRQVGDSESQPHLSLSRLPTGVNILPSSGP